MLLAIDIGNTSIAIGVFEGEKLRTTWRMATSIQHMADEYATFLLNIMRHQELYPASIKGITMCSVVPPLTTTFIDLSQRYFNITPLVVGAGIKTGVSIRMDNPREVGADRIADAAAAHHLYSGPVIVIDLGTVATGIATAAEALTTRTAQLPRVELVRPKKVIGTNTVTAMQSGIVYGYVSLVEGMVARIQNELGEKATVIATGGYADLISKETTIIDEVNPNLTLIGLRLIYQMNKD